MKKQIDFEKLIIRQDYGSRGGGIEINLTTLGFKGEKMATYCNYLGGGLIGKICVNDTITAFSKPITEKKLIKLEEIGEQLKQFFHTKLFGSLENYQSNQNLPISAY